MCPSVRCTSEASPPGGSKSPSLFRGHTATIACAGWLPEGIRPPAPVLQRCAASPGRQRRPAARIDGARGPTAPLPRRSVPSSLRRGPATHLAERRPRCRRGSILLAKALAEPGFAEPTKLCFVTIQLDRPSVGSNVLALLRIIQLAERAVAGCPNGPNGMGAWFAGGTDRPYLRICTTQASSNRPPSRCYAELKIMLPPGSSSNGNLLSGYQ